MSPYHPANSASLRPEGRARAAYRAKRLDEALDLLTRIIALEPEDGAWYERRAQVLVDLKRFEPAVDDFNTAVSLYEPDYRSLGLLSNRALAYEGLSDWEAAVRDYSEAIRLSRDIGGVPPYVLNSRGNALVRTRHRAARARVCVRTRSCVFCRDAWSYRCSRKRRKGKQKQKQNQILKEKKNLKKTYDAAFGRERFIDETTTVLPIHTRYFFFTFFLENVFL